MSRESVPPSPSSHSLITHSLSEKLLREMPKRYPPNICVPHYHHPLSASYPRPTTTAPAQPTSLGTDFVTITRSTHATVPLSTHYRTYRTYRNLPVPPTTKTVSLEPTSSDDEDDASSNDSTTPLIPTAPLNTKASSTRSSSQPIDRIPTTAPGSPYPTTPSTLHPTRLSFLTHGIHTLPTPSAEVPPYALCSLCYRRFINDTAFQNPRLAFTVVREGRFPAVKVKRCGHLFHRCCLERRRRNTCPRCGKVLWRWGVGACLGWLGKVVPVGKGEDKAGRGKKGSGKRKLAARRSELGVLWEDRMSEFGLCEEEQLRGLAC